MDLQDRINELEKENKKLIRLNKKYKKSEDMLYGLIKSTNIIGIEETEDFIKFVDKYKNFHNEDNETKIKYEINKALNKQKSDIFESLNINSFEEIKQILNKKDEDIKLYIEFKDKYELTSKELEMLKHEANNINQNGIDDIIINIEKEYKEDIRLLEIEKENIINDKQQKIDDLIKEYNNKIDKMEKDYKKNITKKESIEKEIDYINLSEKYCKINGYKDVNDSIQEDITKELYNNIKIYSDIYTKIEDKNNIDYIINWLIENRYVNSNKVTNKSRIINKYSRSNELINIFKEDLKYVYFSFRDMIRIPKKIWNDWINLLKEKINYYKKNYYSNKYIESKNKVNNIIPNISKTQMGEDKNKINLEIKNSKIINKEDTNLDVKAYVSEMINKYLEPGIIYDIIKYNKKEICNFKNKLDKRCCSELHIEGSDKCKYHDQFCNLCGNNKNSACNCKIKCKENNCEKYILIKYNFCLKHKKKNKTKLNL